MNVNDVGANSANVEPYGFENYTRYTLVFTAAAGDTIRVWMYIRASPGYVVIDDASLTVGRGVNTITSGSWTVNPDVFVPPFASFSFSGDQFSANGRFEAGEVAAKSACGGPGGCHQEGDRVGRFLLKPEPRPVRPLRVQLRIGGDHVLPGR